MKKLLVLSAIALVGIANAQTTFGVKAGYAGSQLTGEDDEMDFEGIAVDKKLKSGFYVGGFAEHKFTEKFALQGELQYAALGGRYEGKFEDSGYHATLNMDFKINQILIPISAKYYPVSNFSLSGGPFVGFVVSNKFEAKFKDSNLPADVIAEANNQLDVYSDEFSDSFDDSLQKVTFGVQFGAEYTIYKGLMVDARYNVGLSNLEKDSETTSKMSYFQVGLGYRF